MKRKWMTLLMAGMLAISALAGCGTDEKQDISGASAEKSAAEESVGGSSETTVQNENGSFQPQKYTIALPYMTSGYTPFAILRTNCDLVEELTNGTIINDQRKSTPDEILSFVEAQCAAGVDGLMFTSPSDSILPTVTQLCEEAGVYWAIAHRSIKDPEIKKLVEASPYYIGNCYEDEEAAGYNCGKWMGEAGYKKIAIISQTKGDTTGDAREEGLAKACEEYGIEIVGESRGSTQASDITAATESFLASNPDLDCIFYVGTTVSGGHEACINTIQSAGREEVKFVTIDFPDKMVEDFETGILVYAYAQVNLTYDNFILLMRLVNTIQGYPISDAGAPVSMEMPMIGVDNVEDAQKYAEINGNVEYLFYSEEEIVNQLCKWNNPNLDEIALQEMADTYVENNR